MTKIINIHTTTEVAIINLVEDGKILDTREQPHAREHAGFLHTTLLEMLNKNRMGPRDLHAIGVTNGPGSYTGIRVGLASANGLAFALKIPLISISTLELLAFSAILLGQSWKGWYCPMIDARRMEVYASLFDGTLAELQVPEAIVLGSGSFGEALEREKIWFIGSGAPKFRAICTHPQAHFSEVKIGSQALGELSWKKFQEGKGEIRPYATPLYIKEFRGNS